MTTLEKIKAEIKERLIAHNTINIFEIIDKYAKQEPIPEQWRELKETITEMRDNDGTGTQQEVCKFLVNYMEVLEKQMIKPQESDEISERNLKMWEEIFKAESENKK